MATPFTIHIEDSVIEDLKKRLSSPRLPDQLKDAGWAYGTELSTLEDLLTYWRDKYDWRVQEKYLNSFQQYRAVANDVNVHFIHERSQSPAAIPIVLLHGWPGSFFEFHKVIRLLQNEQHTRGSSFHIVVPSLPGYGFSSRPELSGFDVVQMAKTINELMLSLGYDAYIAQGGDWGAAICKALGLLHPAHCKAIHINLCFATPKVTKPWHLLQLATVLLARYTGIQVPLLLSGPEISNMTDALKFQDEGSGYFKLQSTRPQTISYALNDSPTGLLAYILEKFQAWSDCNGDVFSCFTKDEVITNICLYWFTETISSSMRLYYETMHSAFSQRLIGFGSAAYVPVPTAVALFPKEILKPPRAWAESAYNVQQWSTFDRGGHFAALETPDVLAQDIVQFVTGPAASVLSK